MVIIIFKNYFTHLPLQKKTKLDYQNPILKNLKVQI